MAKRQTRAARKQGNRASRKPATRTPKRAVAKAGRARGRSKAKRPAAKRPRKPAPQKRPTASTKASTKAPAKKRQRAPVSAGTARKPAAHSPRLERTRRTLDEVVPTPPSSLHLSRRPSAARSGRAELADARRDHAGMSSAITSGDVDASLETAYFSGDGAPGGDNPTPDQDIVDDIGRALGVEFQDNEELGTTEKVSDRDRHRWELDPASSEDYKERK